MKTKPDRDELINVAASLPQPYRTGSYLVYDYDGDDQFRRGDEIDPPFRASGSHQLDVPQLTARLDEVSKTITQPGGRLHVFDLRQETHIFYLLPPKYNVFADGRAVSWYADKDWSNVGQSQDWITADEESARIKILTVPTTQKFTLDHNKDTGNVTPLSVTDITVKGAATEAMIVAEIGWRFSFPTIYHRVPVTDHCGPSDQAANLVIDLVKQSKIDPIKDWAHFHCHGGDGRTTTFLAIYDMVYRWKTHGAANFPSLKYFADRQVTLSQYKLDPATMDPKSWKYAVAVQRWQKLGEIRDKLAAGRPTATGEAKEIGKSQGQ